MAPSNSSNSPGWFSNLQLDAVSIIAILGEGSITRNAQAFAATWHHVLPRILPAPQALIKHERETRLPIKRGMIIGIYSGRMLRELNWFTQLLHPESPRPFEVQVYEVKKIDEDKPQLIYNVKKYGVLFRLSMLGYAMSGALLSLAIWKHDWYGLAANVFLSLTASLVGAASWWRIILEEVAPQKDRKDDIPDGDVIIFYPDQGAFKIINCNEYVSRLYFTAEVCEPVIADNLYRFIALSSTITLILGIICLGNSHPILKASFTGAYIVINILYWAASAWEPTTHWEHDYKVTPTMSTRPKSHSLNMAPTSRRSTTEMEAQRLSRTETSKWPRTINLSRLIGTGKAPKSKATNTPQDHGHIEEPEENFTSALWTAIALTGRTRWLQDTGIVPNNEAWEGWVKAASEHATTKPHRDHRLITLPQWEFQEELKEQFRKVDRAKKRRPGLGDVITTVMSELAVVKRFSRGKKGVHFAEGGVVEGEANEEEGHVVNEEHVLKEDHATANNELDGSVQEVTEEPKPSIIEQPKPEQ